MLIVLLHLALLLFLAYRLVADYKAKNGFALSTVLMLLILLVGAAFHSTVMFVILSIIPLILIANNKYFRIHVFKPLKKHVNY